jgi:hypothetical protein
LKLQNAEWKDSQARYLISSVQRGKAKSLLTSAILIGNIDQDLRVSIGQRG